MNFTDFFAMSRSWDNDDLDRDPDYPDPDWPIFTALYCMQRGLSDERLSVRPSVCLSKA